MEACLQGFPRSDIDVHAARIDRNKVIVLTNDHKAISEQIEEALHRLHEAARHISPQNGCSGIALYYASWQGGFLVKNGVF